MKSRTGGGLAVLQEVLDGGEVPEFQLLVFSPLLSTWFFSLPLWFRV